MPNINPDQEQAIQNLIHAGEEARDALKDIINSAANNDPYTPEEILDDENLFIQACNNLTTSLEELQLARKS